MAFLSKDEMLAHAARLGVELDGLTWPQQQAAVAAALRSEQEANAPAMYHADPNAGREQEERIHLKPKKKITAENCMGGKTILVSPEIKGTNIQLIKYDEDLGEEVEVEEKKVDGTTIDQVAHDTVTGTYYIKGKTGRHTIAQSTLPKINAQITFNPQTDMVPVVTYNGRSGYLWTHQQYPNVKDLLMQSGHYYDYQEKFSKEPAIWYSAGKLLTCDINLVHSVFAEIERKERETAALRDGLR